MLLETVRSPGGCKVLSAYGTWHVTADSFASRVPNSDFGVWRGFIDEIAFKLPQRQVLTFEPASGSVTESTSTFCEIPTVHDFVVVRIEAEPPPPEQTYLDTCEIAKKLFVERPVTVHPDGHIGAIKLKRIV